MRISDWSSDVCSSDLDGEGRVGEHQQDSERGEKLEQFRRTVDPAQHRDLDPDPQRRDGDRRQGHGQPETEPVPQQRREPAEEAVAAIGAEHVERTVRRSEEHTSELQSLMRISYAVFCLNKKKTEI